MYVWVLEYHIKYRHFEAKGNLPVTMIIIFWGFFLFFFLDPISENGFVILCHTFALAA